jgi:hypothetical protein
LLGNHTWVDYRFYYNPVNIPARQEMHTITNSDLIFLLLTYG